MLLAPVDADMAAFGPLTSMGSGRKVGMVGNGVHTHFGNLIRVAGSLVGMRSDEGHHVFHAGLNDDRLD